MPSGPCRVNRLDQGNGRSPEVSAWFAFASMQLARAAARSHRAHHRTERPEHGLNGAQPSLGSRGLRGAADVEEGVHDVMGAMQSGDAKYPPVWRCHCKPELQLALVLLAKREIFDEFKNGVLTGRPTPTYIRNTGGDVA